MRTLPTGKPVWFALPMNGEGAASSSGSSPSGDVTRLFVDLVTEEGGEDFSSSHDKGFQRKLCISAGAGVTLTKQRI